MPCGDPVVSQAAHRGRQLGLVRGHGAALAGRDDLARVERQAGEQPERPAWRPAVARPERAGGVLDEDDVLRHGGLELLPGDRPAEEMDGEHGAGPAASRPPRRAPGGRGTSRDRRPRAPHVRGRARRRSRSRGRCRRGRSPRRRGRRRARGARDGSRRFPDDTATASAVPTALASARSNASTCGPIVSWPLASTSATAASSASPTSGRASRIGVPLTPPRRAERGTTRSSGRAPRRARLRPRSRAATAPCRRSGSGARRRCSATARSGSRPGSPSGA